MYVSQISSKKGPHSNVIKIFVFHCFVFHSTNVLCSIQQFDRSGRSGRVNGKRPMIAQTYHRHICEPGFNYKIFRKLYIV